jgi:hypothetical protein
MRAFSTILSLILLASLALSAQVPDSKGTDFWLTYLPNFHNNVQILPENPALQLEHQLYIYIGSEVPTRGRITLRDAQGAERVVTFVINDPRQLYEFKTFFLPYELRGWNYHGEINYASMQTELVSLQSVHIEADDDVTVYSLNQGDLTSDAFMVLPTDAIGDDYVIMSYTSDISPSDPFNTDVSGGSTPSQFAIVATQDGTDVEIVPSCATFIADSGQSYTVTLNRGQSYLVQPDPRINRRADLTGSLVRASKPVAVFAGHQRATIPIENKGILGSRDCLVEQMNPVVTWGKSAFITPLASSSDELPDGFNLFRVVSAFDSTQVFVDNQNVAMINAGQFYQAPITKAHVVETTRPTMVGMFRKTSGPGQAGQARYGDPFLALVPPFEQFMDSYRFISIQAYDYVIVNNQPTPISTVYDEQWLNVVISSKHAGTIRMDGAPLSASFAQIGTSAFSWAQVRMTDGVHEITADTIFGIYVYGYGRANSYGYIGGMAFRPLDVYSPRLSGTTSCGTFTGRVTDSLLGDTKLKEVRVIPGSEINVSVTLGAFTPPQAVVPFQAVLVNPYLDGRFSMEAMDHVRQTTRTSINVPGFTIGTVGITGGGPDLIRRVLPISRRRCDTIVIENYGQFPHTVTELSTALGAEITEPALPFTLAPGEQTDVVICRTFTTAGLQYDTLLIGDTCLLRPSSIMEFNVRDDQEAPEITGAVDKCSTTVDVLIADNRAFDFGIASLTVLHDVFVNCTIDTVVESVPFARYTIHILDPLQDAIFGFEAVDSAGNRRVWIDTVGGFTLAISGEAGLFSSRSMPSVALGEVTCDTITITNYGLTRQIITEVFVRANVRFSTPRSQFPIVIEPGASAPLTLCYEPRVADGAADIDTVDFVHGCLVRAMEVQATGETVQYQGLSRCDLPVMVTVDQLGGVPLLMPNPAQDEVTIVLPKETDQLRVRVVDVSGRIVIDRSWSGESSASFLVELRDIGTGTYGVILEQDHQTHRMMLVIQ